MQFSHCASLIFSYICSLTVPMNQVSALLFMNASVCLPNYCCIYTYICTYFAVTDCLYKQLYKIFIYVYDNIKENNDWKLYLHSQCSIDGFVLVINKIPLNEHELVSLNVTVRHDHCGNCANRIPEGTQFPVQKSIICYSSIKKLETDVESLQS